MHYFYKLISGLFIVFILISVSKMIFRPSPKDVSDKSRCVIKMICALVALGSAFICFIVFMSNNADYFMVNYSRLAMFIFCVGSIEIMWAFRAKMLTNIGKHVSIWMWLLINTMVFFQVASGSSGRGLLYLSLLFSTFYMPIIKLVKITRD